MLDISLSIYLLWLTKIFYEADYFIPQFVGVFFPVPCIFQAQILSLLENQVQKSPGRHLYIFEQNLTCNAEKKLSWLFLSGTSEITGLLLWITPLNTLVLSHWVSFVLGFTAVLSLSFWQQHHLVLVNSLVITKFTLMERITGINPLRKEDSWVEVSHTCGEQSSR